MFVLIYSIQHYFTHKLISPLSVTKMSHKTSNAHLATNARVNLKKFNNSRISNALNARHNDIDSLQKARKTKKYKKESTKTHKANRKVGRTSQNCNSKRRQTNQIQSIVNRNADLTKLIELVNQKIQEYSVMQQIDESIMCVYLCPKLKIYLSATNMSQYKFAYIQSERQSTNYI